MFIVMYAYTLLLNNRVIAGGIYLQACRKGYGAKGQ